MYQHQNKEKGSFARTGRNLTTDSSIGVEQMKWNGNHEALSAGRLAILALAFVAAMSPVLRAVDKEVCGTVHTDQGVTILTVWGDAHERGYAYGRLLAPHIMAGLEATLFDPNLIRNKEDYEERIAKGIAGKMRWTDEQIAELKGMLAGMSDVLGEAGMQIERLGRAVALRDLQAVNCLPDWYRFMCSSFSAWGNWTKDGKMITGRNLDFRISEKMQGVKFVIVYRDPGGDRKSWMTLSWPGMIGAFTGMNEDGLTVSMHDAPGRQYDAEQAYVPRSMSLREALETADTIQGVEDVLRASPVVCGNNIHVSTPFTGQEVPAAILEYDGAQHRGQGVTRRVAGKDGLPNGAPGVMCTNHYRERGEVTSCTRFEAMRDALAAEGAREEPIDSARAWSVIRAAAVSDTLHTVVFYPNDRRFEVAFPAYTAGEAESEIARFDLNKLLGKPVAAGR